MTSEWPIETNLSISRDFFISKMQFLGNFYQKSQKRFGGLKKVRTFAIPNEKNGPMQK